MFWGVAWKIDFALRVVLYKIPVFKIIIFLWKSTFIFTECEKLTAFPWKVSPKPSLFDCSSIFPFCQINPRPWLFSFFRLLQRMLQDCFLKTKETEKYWMSIPRCVYFLFFYANFGSMCKVVKVWWTSYKVPLSSFVLLVLLVFVCWCCSALLQFRLVGMGHTSWVLKAMHMIGICLSRQWAPEKYNQEKNPTYLCLPREFLKTCLPCLVVINACSLDYGINKLSHVLAAWSSSSFDLVVLRAQRIIGFYLNYPQINDIGKSGHMIVWRAQVLRHWSHRLWREQCGLICFIDSTLCHNL